MFRTFHVAIYSNPESLVETAVKHTGKTRVPNVILLWIEQKYISARPFSNMINMVQDVLSDNGFGTL